MVKETIVADTLVSCLNDVSSLVDSELLLETYAFALFEYCDRSGQPR